MLDRDMTPRNPVTALRKPPLGSGFGDAVENRRVEKAAVNAVIRHYVAQGWQVETKELEQQGYDLLCRRRSAVHHEEVKGIRGSICSFVITANEKAIAEVDYAFRLVAVTNALDPKGRRLRHFTGPEMLDSFEMSAISFVAKPRN